jgi:hypothetical protein
LECGLRLLDALASAVTQRPSQANILPLREFFENGATAFETFDILFTIARSDRGKLDNTVIVKKPNYT